MTSHESTKRVLYHVVNSYQTWRSEPVVGVPNEFTDDAVRIGEQHLREADWFPEDEGWLANNTVPSDGTKFHHDNVLALIDAELVRLRDATSIQSGSRGWRQGVRDARYAAEHQLQFIRDIYVVESLTRETESLRLYGLQEDSTS